MPRRPDNLETVRLAIAILRRIPRHKKITARELHTHLIAEGFDRDLRSVQRQIESLSRHFDIECDASDRPYGYRWKEMSEGLSLQTMTEKEALLLTLAEQHLKALLPPRVVKSMDGYFAQARRNLGPDKPADLERQWLGKVRTVSTTQPLLPPTIREGVLEAVSEALYGNHWLRVDYRNAAGKGGVAEVMPLGLAQQGPAMYLVCRYKGYDNERTQALHRMVSAQVLPQTFERPKDFDLEKYEGEGRFRLGDGKRVRLQFHITRNAGRHLLETRLSTDQEAVETSDGYRIRATVVESEWLHKWLRGFGDAVTGVKLTTAKKGEGNKS